MASTNPNKQVLIPDLAMLIKEIKQDILSSINCVQVGRIESFDETNQTATIQIMLKRITDPQNNKVVSYPILADCPVYFAGGKTSGLLHPVQQSDECLIFFNDRNIDNWFSSGQESIPDNYRMHNLSDGFALVGIKSSPNVINDFDPLAVKLFNSEAFLKIKTNKIALANTAGDFYTIFNSLMDALIAATDANSIPLSPATIAALQAVKTAFAILFQAGTV